MRRKKKPGPSIFLKNEESLEQFKSSDLVASVLSHPALSNFDLRETDILKEVSEVTNAPLLQEALN